MTVPIRRPSLPRSESVTQECLIDSGQSSGQRSQRAGRFHRSSAVECGATTVNWGNALEGHFGTSRTSPESLRRDNSHARSTFQWSLRGGDCPACRSVRPITPRSTLAVLERLMKRSSCGCPVSGCGAAVDGGRGFGVGTARVSSSRRIRIVAIAMSRSTSAVPAATRNPGEADREGLIVNSQRPGGARCRRGLSGLGGVSDLSSDAVCDGRPGDGAEQGETDRAADLLAHVEHAGGDTRILFGDFVQGGQGKRDEYHSRRSTHLSRSARPTPISNAGTPTARSSSGPPVNDHSREVDGSERLPAFDQPVREHTRIVNDRS